MGSRSEGLAARIEAGAEALASFVEALSPAEWETIVPNDERSVGTVVHHVASAYPTEVGLAQSMAQGNAIAGVTWDMVDAMNADHASANESVPQAETIALLRQNSKEAAASVRQFTDEQLDTAVPVSINADAVLTAQFFIEDHALRHSSHHFANIRAALGK